MLERVCGRGLDTALLFFLRDREPVFVKADARAGQHPFQFRRLAHEFKIVFGLAKAHDPFDTGAGLVILRMLEREGLEGHIIVVTRWFGGVKLGGDRFRRVQDAVRVYLEGM